MTSVIDDGTASGITSATGGPGGTHIGGGTATAISDGGHTALEPEVFQKAGASRTKVYKGASSTYEPTTDWFAGHKYYTQSAVKSFTQEEITRHTTLSALKGPPSVTMTPLAHNAPGGMIPGQELNQAALAQVSAVTANVEDPTGFFPTAATQAKMEKEKNEELKTLCEKYNNRENNLSALHAMLYPHVTNDGKISLENVLAVVRGIAVPHANVTDAVNIWWSQLGVEVDRGFLTYEEAMSGFEDLFNERLAKETSEACFKLCDITDANFILKDEIKGLRPHFIALDQQPSTDSPKNSPHRERGNGGGFEGHSGDQRATVSGDDAASTAAITSAAVSPTPARRQPLECDPAYAGPGMPIPTRTISEHLNYLIVKAVLRCFEHVALAEEEKVRAAQSKGRKKKKNAPLIMPTKRQFHISRTEFREMLAKDAYLIVAFLPFALLCATERR